jgi:uncharacterized membrane protein
MRDPKLPRLVLGFLLAGAVLYFSQIYAKLPDVMPSHFNANGVPNGWMPKSDFFLFLLPAGLLIAVIAFLSPKLMAILPPNMINLPNKDYWLAPERRAETVQYFEAALSWFGCAIFSLILFTFYIAAQASLNPSRGFDSTSMFIALGAFFAFLIFWLVRITSHFFRTPESHG